MGKWGANSQRVEENKIEIGIVINGQHVSRTYHTYVEKHNCDNNFEENLYVRIVRRIYCCFSRYENLSDIHR